MIIGAKTDNLPPLIKGIPMNRYRVEILGRVPNGLTHNEVFATINSVIREYHNTQSVTKRKLSGNMVSIVTVFEAAGTAEAASAARYAGNSVTNFSFDTIVKVVRD